MQRPWSKFQKVLRLPEWLYLQEAKLGDKDAFGKLYLLYVDKIYRFIFFRVGQRKMEAEDITADTFCKAWERLDTFKEGSFQAWLYMIAKNTIIDFYRRHKVHVPLFDTLADEKPSLIEEVGISLEIGRVKKAMRKLTQDQQDVLILKFIEDLPNKEIAEILDKTEEAIRALQHRAIQELKKTLNI